MGVLSTLYDDEFNTWLEQFCVLDEDENIQNYFEMPLEIANALAMRAGGQVKVWDSRRAGPVMLNLEDKPESGIVNQYQQGGESQNNAVEVVDSENEDRNRMADPTYTVQSPSIQKETSQPKDKGNAAKLRKALDKSYRSINFLQKRNEFVKEISHAVDSQ